MLRGRFILPPRISNIKLTRSSRRGPHLILSRMRSLHAPPEHKARSDDWANYRHAHGLRPGFRKRLLNEESNESLLESPPFSSSVESHHSAPSEPAWKCR